MKIRSIYPVSHIAWLILFASSVTYSQGSVTDKVDEFVRAEMQKRKIPRVSLAVVKGGKPMIVKGYGLANVEHNVPGQARDDLSIGFCRQAIYFDGGDDPGRGGEDRAG